MSDFDEAKELLTIITKRTHSSILDEDVISAVRLLLLDYIDRQTKDAGDAARLTN
ncbi:MAG: hypothetical protein WAM06_05570 [Methyloceanibacter sp.]